LGTAWSVPSADDIVYSVSVSVEADLLGRFVDKSSEGSNYIDVINVGKV